MPVSMVIHQMDGIIVWLFSFSFLQNAFLYFYNYNGKVALIEIYNGRTISNCVATSAMGQKPLALDTACIGDYSLILPIYIAFCLSGRPLKYLLHFSQSR